MLTLSIDFFQSLSKSTLKSAKADVLLILINKIHNQFLFHLNKFYKLNKKQKIYNLLAQIQFQIIQCYNINNQFIKKSYQKTFNSQLNFDKYQMASKYLQKFPIPAGFQQILSDFTRQVLRDQPSNIIQYAAQYFQMLQKGKKLQFNSKYNVKKQDKKYQLAYNAKNAQDISKKAGSITQKLNKGPSVHNSVSANPSQPASRHVIGTQKTVTGEQTSNYVNNLSNNISNQQFQQQQNEQQNHQQMIQEAIAATVDKLFEQIDVDKNGYLQSKQIQRFVKLVSGQVGDVAFRTQDIGQFIAIVDNDRDGKISKQELGHFVLSLFKAIQGQQQ